MSTQGKPDGLYWLSAAESAALLRVAALADRLGGLRNHVNASLGVRSGWSGVRSGRSNGCDTPRDLVLHLRGAQESLLMFIRAVGDSWRGERSEIPVVPCGGGAEDTGPVPAMIEPPPPPGAIGSELRSIYQQLDPHRPGTGLEPLWRYLKRGPFEQTGDPLVEGGAPTFVPSPLPLASNALSLALIHLHEGAIIAKRAAPRAAASRARHSFFLASVWLGRIARLRS